MCRPAPPCEFFTHAHEKKREKRECTWYTLSWPGLCLGGVLLEQTRSLFFGQASQQSIYVSHFWEQSLAMRLPRQSPVWYRMLAHGISNLSGVLRLCIFAFALGQKHFISEHVQYAKSCLVRCVIQQGCTCIR